MKHSSPAAKFIHNVLHQECESAHRRLVQALGLAEHDQVEGIRGYRRAIKKIRCALMLTAGAFSSEKRQALDARWRELARRLGDFRDVDAREKKLNEIIDRLPAIDQEGARIAWQSAQDPKDVVLQSAIRREVLEGLTGDTEQLISVTEKIRFTDLTPEMVAGSIEHLWNRARSQADKSWVDRDEAWLHSLRKRVQRTHIAFRLMRVESDERGLELEKRFDAAAKAMGELRDASMIRMLLPAKDARGEHQEFVASQAPSQAQLLSQSTSGSPAQVASGQTMPTQGQVTQALPNPAPPIESCPAIETLRMLILQTESEAMKQARKLVVKAFKSDIEKTLRHITLHIHSL
ncbi:MAG: CHAD domain-containing protein [Phycisphaerae bacterium]